MKTIINYINTKHILEASKLRLEIISENEKILNQEKEQLTIFVKYLKEKLEKIDIELKQLNGIEYKLYYEIVVRGLTITKAIDKVAFDSDKDVSTIWKNYYPNVKKKINSLTDN